MLCGGSYPQGRFSAILFWAIVKFTRFRDTKISAHKRFSTCLQNGKYPFHAAKLVLFFELSKKKAILSDFFSVKCTV
jgi:hypothetical protein